MKVLIIADALDKQSAGVHVYVRQLVDALAKQDNSPHEYILIREKREDGLPFRQIILKPFFIRIVYDFFKIFFVIPYLARKHKVDVVFEPAHFGPFNLPKSIKRVTMIHDLTPILFPEWHITYSRLLQKYFLPGILKKADLILSNSKHTEKDLLRIYPHTKGKVKTILLGRDEFYFPTMEKMFLFRNGIRPRGYFLFVGTLEPRKGLDTLLEAFSQFKSKNKGKTKCWKNKSFETLYKTHPFQSDIIITGYVTKEALCELYSHCISMVYPSNYEGFGFPILEAMSCGAKVITTNVSSLPEVGGEASYYFTPGDVVQLSLLLEQSLFQINNSERNEIGIRQSKKFSWNQYAKSFEEGLNTL